MSTAYHPNPTFYSNPAAPAVPIDALAWSAQEDHSYRPPMVPNPSAAMSTAKRVALAAAALCTIGAGAALGVAVFSPADSPQPEPRPPPRRRASSRLSSPRPARQAPPRSSPHLR